MKCLIISILLIVFCLSPLFLKAEPDDLCHYSTEGTDFWFGFMENRLRGDIHYLEITVTSRIGAQLTVTYGPDDTPIWNDAVGANSSIILPIDYDLLEPMGSETIEDKGIHLRSTNLVSVYAFNYRTQSSDVAVIYPTASLGKEYFAMCYTPHPSSTIESNSEFLIVASEDNTTVNITPSVDTDGGHKANEMFSIPLNQGQSYQVQSMNSIVPGQGDLTGSHISADQPIAFYSGVKSTSVPFSGNSRDHLYEQIPPTSTWGREFFVVPLRSRTKDTYRVLAAEDGTTVIIEGINSTILLNRGDYKEFELNSSQACRIISTKRVLLAQYCRSQTVDGSSGVGDPFMIIISPVVQKINDITFEAYVSELITNIFYVNIVTLTSEVDAITLDGNSIRNHFKVFPAGIYSYAQVPIAKGTHRLLNDHPGGGFLACVYGFGDRGDTESYGYGVGFNLDIQLDIGGIINNDTIMICPGTEYKLDAGNYFDTYLWNTNSTNSSLMVSQEGKYWVTASTRLGCEKSDTVFIKVDHPKIDLGMDRGTCNPGELILDAGSGFKTYLWQDGSTSQTIKVDSTDNYMVTAINEAGCKALDTIRVVVFKAIFSQNYKVATDVHADISFHNESEGSVSYLWEFGDGETSEEENPIHHYSAIGEYNVVLHATSDFGCTGTTSSMVKIIPFTLATPNAFRPDSEIAENRIFLPIAEGIDPENYKFQIFSRVGSTLFESSNPENGWDGKMPNGTSAGPGIFVWVVKFLDLQGYHHMQKGTVMLVR